MLETAVLVEVPEAEDHVHGWRTVHDPVASRGIPAHITILFPFVPPHRFDERVLETIREIAASVRPLEFELTGVGEFPGAIWLRPEPEHLFQELTRRLWDSFPAYPPYGGTYPDSQPHLTVAVVSNEAEQRRLSTGIGTELVPKLPIVCSAATLSVFMSDHDGVWQRRDSIALGG